MKTYTKTSPRPTLKPTQYRTVSTHTLAGQRTAERLHANGWRTVRTGLFCIWFEKKPAIL